MAYQFLIILTSAIFYFCLVQKSCLAGEFQCQGKDFNYTAEQVKQMKDCLHYSGSDSVWKLKASEFPCFGSCLFKVRGYMSDDGNSVVKEKVLEVAKKVVPAAQLKAISDGVIACIDKYGQGHEVDEKGCMKFMQFGQCVQEMLMDVCI